MKHILTIVFVVLASQAKAQKVNDIFFNLYTDSLKKGVYNYINVDGKLDGDRFFPLTSSEVILSSSAGRWEGNSLVIDTAYKMDSVVITAVLKAEPAIKKTITIYMKKVDEQPALKSEDELIEGWRRDGKKKKKN